MSSEAEAPDLTELEALLERATPGKWKLEFHPLQKGNPATLIMREGAQIYEKFLIECPWGKDGDTDTDGDGVRDCTAAEAQANAALIVAMHEALPSLLAIARRVGKLEAALKVTISRIESLLATETKPTLAMYPKSGVEYIGVITADDYAIKVARAALSDGT